MLSVSSSGNHICGVTGNITWRQKKKKMICSYNPNTSAFPVAMGSGSLDIQWDIVVVSIGMALIDKWIWVLAPQEVALFDSVALLKELCHCERRF